MLDFSSSIDYAYEHYGPPLYGCICPEDDYCRCSVYEDLTISSINLERVLAVLIGRKFTLTDGLLAEVQELGLDKAESYRIAVEPSYYGEEITGIHLRNEKAVLKRIHSWVSAHGAEIDLDGIKTYLLERGHQDIVGSTNQAVRKAVQNENNVSFEPSYVQRTHDAYVHLLNLRDIHVPNERHFDSVEPRQPVSDTQVITGIVVRENSSSYRLIDGYHRMKWAMAHAKSGHFIVLS